jgi:sortase A
LKQKLLRLTADSLVLVGIGGVVVGLVGLSEGWFYQYVQEAQFEEVAAGDDARIATGEAITPSRPRPELYPKDVPNLEAPRQLLPNLAKLWSRDPQLIGKLEVPSVGLSVMIREGVDEDTLRKAAGHLSSSALPGEAGNFVILGHRDTFFRPLRNITRGDSIRVRTLKSSFTYVVESISVMEPESVRIERGSGRTSTLITCFPFSYTGPAPRRFVVQARLTASTE